MDRLKDKVAIVTGSTKGIGEGIARCFHAEGAKLVITSRHEDEARAMAEELGMKEGRAIYVCADVTKEEDIKLLIKKTIEAFGKLDVLVNNAGRFIVGNCEEITDDEWMTIHKTNLRSTFLCSKYAIPYLKETKGNIVNVSSMAGIAGFVKSAAYSPTKAGQLALAQGIALDLGQYGIRANCICPGHIMTPLADDWYVQMGDDGSLLQAVVDRHPLKRRGTIYDCGWAAVYLASDEASFVTGVALPVDGGVTIGY